ncbi:MAG: hypothetical protein HEEMFOPI_01660 [Holosporales bacterium]
MIKILKKVNYIRCLSSYFFVNVTRSKIKIIFFTLFVFLSSKNVFSSQSRTLEYEFETPHVVNNYERNVFDFNIDEENNIDDVFSCNILRQCINVFINCINCCSEEYRLGMEEIHQYRLRGGTLPNKYPYY